MAPAPFVRKCSFIRALRKCRIRHSVNVALRVGVLAKGKRIIKDLIFPHVKIENHDDENDAIVEPFTSHVYRPIFFP